MIGLTGICALGASSDRVQSFPMSTFTDDREARRLPRDEATGDNECVGAKFHL